MIHIHNLGYVTNNSTFSKHSIEHLNEVTLGMVSEHINNDERLWIQSEILYRGTVA